MPHISTHHPRPISNPHKVYSPPPPFFFSLNVFYPDTIKNTCIFTCSSVLATCIKTIPRSTRAAPLRDFTCLRGDPPFSIFSTEYLHVPINSCLVFLLLNKIWFWFNLYQTCFDEIVLKKYFSFYNEQKYSVFTSFVLTFYFLDFYFSLMLSSHVHVYLSH